jgi:hypothetical protein
VPAASPLTMYELYPGGFVMRYDLGFVQPGYYYIWYFADTPGRHRSVFVASSGYSNTVIIDVYMIEPSPRPIPPSPQEKCEQKSYCHWVNGQCQCTMPPDPERDRCLEKPYCSWVDGHCLCTMPDPEKEKCELDPLCDWVDGHCYCRGAIDPEQEKCEQSPNCNWANEQCLCTGFKPSDDPEKRKCEQNPECSWADGQCLCRGLNPIGDSENPKATEELGATMNEN